MITTSFNKRKGILYTKYSGIITVFDIVEFIIDTKNNKQYPRNLRILSDAREADFLLNPEDLDIIINENNQSLKNYNFIFDAILVDSPKETALTVLYQKLSSTDNYKFELFISERKAENWLTRMDNYYIYKQAI